MPRVKEGASRGARPAPTSPPAPPHEAGGAPAPHHFGVTDVLLLGMALIWGVNFSVVKFGTDVLAPLAFNGARMVLASVALLVLAAGLREHWPTRRTAVALLLLGMLGNGIYQYLFVEGIALTRAGNAALMLAATPALVALIGRIRGVERTGPRGLAGIALSIVGIGIIVFSSTQEAGSPSDASARGDLLVLASCVAWALYTVLLKPYTHDVHGIVLSALTMVGGTVPLLLVAAPSLAAASFTALPASAWGAVVYSGLGALVLAYLVWYRGVRVLGPTRTAMYANLQPAIALVVAWLALGETPTLFQIIGALAILLGLVLTRSAR